MALNLDIKPVGKKDPHFCYEKFDQISKAAKSENRIVKHGYFANSDMRCGHVGLKKIAKKRHINLDSLEPGQIVIFVNSKQNRMKMYTTGYSFVYTKMPNYQKINPGVIRLVPKFFSANAMRFDYDGALERVLLREFKH